MDEAWETSEIYMLICRINGKRYIGQSINIKRRLNDHKWNKRCTSIISKAIAKYGWDAFDKTVLEFCPVEELDEKEIHYIAELKPEYNLAKGGNGSKGYKHSKSFREKISKNLLEISTARRKSSILKLKKSLTRLKLPQNPLELLLVSCQKFCTGEERRRAAITGNLLRRFFT